jgi:hypothetical protein
VLKTLASEILGYYLKSRTERNFYTYLSCFFASLGIILLVIIDFMYFVISRDNAFLLIVMSSCCFCISAIIYYMKQRRKYELFQPLLGSYHLLENIFRKIQTGIKCKQPNFYKSFSIGCLALCLATLIIYQYSKKIMKSTKKSK